MDRNRIT